MLATSCEGNIWPERDWKITSENKRSPVMIKNKSITSVSKIKDNEFSSTTSRLSPNRASFKLKPKYRGPTRFLPTLQRRLGEELVQEEVKNDSIPSETSPRSDKRDDCALTLNVLKNDGTAFINFIKRDDE